MLPKVLITNQVPDHVTIPLHGLASLQMGGKKHRLMTRSAVLESIAEVSAIVSQGELRIDDELLDAAPNLRIVANVSIGIDNFDLPALNRRCIWASNAPGFFAQPVAEYVVAGMLVVSRRLKEADAYVRAGNWGSFEPGRWDGRTLKGKSLGIIGFGHIGRSLAAMASGLGMRVLNYSRNDDRAALLSMLSQCDVVSVHVPLTAATRRLIGRREFEAMKATTIFVNTSRGQVVDQDVLVERLEQGALGGAVLDVFESEPHVPETLRSMKNVLITPHIGGGTIESRRLARLCAFENVAAALRGERPPNALNNFNVVNGLIANDGRL